LKTNLARLSRVSLTFLGLFALVGLACQALSGAVTPTEAPTSSPSKSSPTLTPTPLPPSPVQAGEENPDEPVFIRGSIPYTSPFFLNTISAPFVLLEDEAGFVARNLEFQFPLVGQTIGPVEVHPNGDLTYTLALPSVPQGTLVDVDNNGSTDTGVQVFAVAYWSNTWGGPFLEERDGTGWSTAYTSTLTDPERDDEITGGVLIVWAPDEEQAFPTDFGDDGLLFTEDDPTESIPPGYSMVDLNQSPFKFEKQAELDIVLNEGDIAVNDYADLDYSDAFTALFEKVSREYPFTQEKNIDWAQLQEEFSQRVADAQDDEDFYRAIRDFTFAIPDAHVGVGVNPQVFFEEAGGGFGLVLAELTDGRVIVTQVLPDTPASQEGIQVGAEIVTWEGEPTVDAISSVTPLLGPFSTEHHARLAKVDFLTRVPPGTRVSLSYQNPGDSRPTETNLSAVVEYESLFASLSGFSFDELLLPEDGQVLDDSGFGYIRITTFSDDYNLMAQLWERFINDLNDNEVPALILDLRANSGGNSGLALDFAGFFFDEEIPLWRSAYYNEHSQKFEYQDYPAKIRPAPTQFTGPIAVLVSPDCISACEGFAYALTQDGRATIVGNYPTAGAFGEVGRGQYDLPGDLSAQFPTGRSETINGDLIIEGKGVQLDITVPVTEESALGIEDTVLNAAIDALSKEINP